MAVTTAGALAAGAIAAPIIGGIMGGQQADKDRNAANQARQQALAQFAGLSVPEIEQMKLNLEQYQSQGVLTPELEQLVQQGNTAMGDISSDPRLRQEQMKSLDALSMLAGGNMTPADQAAFQLARNQAAGEMQAKNNQVLQEMQQRGQAGSGAELLAKLKNNQSGAQMLQQAQLEEAKAMQQARQQAIAQLANVSGNIRGQDYDEAANLARAKDSIAQFNAQNAQSVGSRNTAIKNQAQLGNLTNAQQLANMNTENMNKQQIANKGLIQQRFGNEMDLASAKAGQYGNQASAADRQAGQTAAMWSGIGQGAGTAFGALANNYSKQTADSPTGGVSEAADVGYSVNSRQGQTRRPF